MKNFSNFNDPNGAIDIIFENRNKAYGAYALRMGYDQEMRKALIYGFSLTLLLVLVPFFANLMHAKASMPIVQYVVDVKPENFLGSKKQPEKKPIEKKPKIKTIALVVPNVVETPIVEYKPPTNESLETAAISTVTQEGEKTNTNVTPEPVVAPTPTPVVPDPPVPVEPVSFAEIMPTFNGEKDGALKYIYNNVRYPDFAQSNSIEGKVFAQFVINEEGKVTNVKILRGIGAGCDEEIERVLRNMPNWSPGFQGKRAIKVKITVPVSFKLVQ